MKICPKCKNVVFTYEKKFCSRDGMLLESVPLCDCGRELAPSDNFCDGCGRAIPKVEAAEMDHVL